MHFLINTCNLCRYSWIIYLVNQYNNKRYVLLNENYIPRILLTTYSYVVLTWSFILLSCCATLCFNQLSFSMSRRLLLDCFYCQDVLNFCYWWCPRFALMWGAFDNWLQSYIWKNFVCIRSFIFNFMFGIERAERVRAT